MWQSEWQESVDNCLLKSKKRNKIQQAKMYTQHVHQDVKQVTASMFLFQWIWNAATLFSLVLLICARKNKNKKITRKIKWHGRNICVACRQQNWRFYHKVTMYQTKLSCWMKRKMKQQKLMEKLHVQNVANGTKFHARKFKRNARERSTPIAMNGLKIAVRRLFFCVVVKMYTRALLSVCVCVAVCCQI